MRGGRVGAGVLAAVVLVAGCGGSGGGEGDDQDGSPKEKQPAVKAAKLSVPSEFRPAQGWDESLPWIPGSVHSIPVAATDDGRVAVMQVASDGYTVKVRDAADGAVRWSSAPWKVPTPVEGAEGSDASGEPAELPGLVSATIGGAPHIVAWAHGTRGSDELNKGTEILRLAVFPAKATGRSVEPLREIDVPVSAMPGDYQINGGEDGSLLVAWGDRDMYPSSTAAVDLTDGKIAVHRDPDKLLPQCARQTMCSGSRVIDVHDGSVLVAMGSGGFGVPGRWSSGDFRPRGVPAVTGFLNSPNGAVYGAGAGRLLAAWHPVPSSGAEADPVWSVHDQGTGELLASMSCDADVPEKKDGDRDYAVGSSPDGRFLFAGPVAFDLERKKGLCLVGDGNPKTVLLASADERGIAYGAVEDTADSEAPTLVRLDLTTPTGSPEVLPAGTELPLITDLKGSGLFVTRDANENILVSLRRRS
ncbi:hypothetical protein ACFXG1_32720 [Streptomyces sp. NPDC059248]|uniref:hypothetical protein n=1 Tax=Streptomyces sp. NPDC059248 TaxID=3346791 RepID=UPI0036B2DF3D